MYYERLQRQRTAFVCLLKRCFQTVLVDGFDGRRSHLQRDPLARRFDEEPLFLQVREEFTLGLIVSVGNIITRPRALSCDLTNSGHYRTGFPYEGAKVANPLVLCNSSLNFLEPVGTMPASILTAITPFCVIGGRKHNVPLRGVVIIFFG
jgi:hypothetical protein